MPAKLQERVASGVILLILILTPLWIWWYRGRVVPETDNPRIKLFNITGLGFQGRWTLEKVSGYDYWWKDFPPAQIVVNEGDSVILRLQSADVTHVFYSPTLGIGPINIEPGYVQSAAFRVRSPGVHYYYCMSICGECHYFMRGSIIVGETNLSDTLDAVLPMCATHHDEPSGSELHDRGKFLFSKMGCIACHGPAGGGGVINPNYTKNTVPSLKYLAQTMALSDEQQVRRLASLIETSVVRDQMQERMRGIARPRVVLGKYESVRDVIRKGRPAARADTTSFIPPLFMPAWEQKLSERDIDAILIYLLQHQVWDEDI